MKPICGLTLIFLFSINPFLFGQKSTSKKGKTTTGQSVLGKIEVSPLAGLNSDGLDFSPSSFENGILFTSTRKAKNVRRKSSKKAFTDLYFAEKIDAKSFKTPLKLKGKINSKAHDGICRYNAQHNAIFFTRNKRKRRTNAGIVLDLSIYSATKENGVWGNVKELKINKKKYSTCHPTFSKDGNVMYFASNRKGGYGGMDLYKSTFENGEWQEPVNLGPSINTKGNELFPTMHSSGTLFYSSNGHKGRGGLDLFQATTQDEMNWTVTSLGNGFNTRRDDFGFEANDDLTEGYYSTNKNGSTGGDDIYFWSVKPEVKTTPTEELVKNNTNKKPVVNNTTKNNTGLNKADFIKSKKKTIVFKDKWTGKPIAGAKVKMSDSERHGLVSSYSTDENGATTIDWDVSSKYFLRAEKKGYTNIEMKLSAEEISHKGPFLMEGLKVKKSEFNDEDFFKPKTIVVSGNVNKNDSKVLIFDNCVESQKAVRLDANGNFDLELDCGCDYIITAVKDGYTSVILDLPLYKKNCEEFKNEKLSLNLHQALAPTIAPVKSTVSYNGNTLTPESTIRLERIYYDFNDYNLKEESKVELNNLANLLVANPSMIIELNSHTDASGPVAYNFDLSEKRAIAVVNYLVSRGVERKQIKPRGYGESKPVNHCLDGVTCTESQHKENRRTEFKVIQYDGWTKVNTEKENLDAAVDGRSSSVLDDKKVITIANIHYNKNDFSLNDAAKESLNHLAEQMLQHPSIKIEISAFTDQSGNAAYNKNLSQKRAQTVANYLSNRGIPTTRFKANGIGMANSSNKGRITEITVTEVKDSNFVVVYKE